MQTLKNFHEGEESKDWLIYEDRKLLESKQIKPRVKKLRESLHFREEWLEP